LPPRAHPSTLLSWDCGGDCANEATNKCVPRTGPTDMCQMPTQEEACVGIKDQTQCSTLGCPLGGPECIRLDDKVGCCR
jgi:hypothetical protein